MVSTEIKNYLRGLYGRPPGQLNPEVLSRVLKGEQPSDVRPADLLEPLLEKSRREVEGLIEQEEDVLSYILFPQVALEFFKRRRKRNPRGNPGRRSVDLQAWGEAVDYSLLGGTPDNPVYPA